MRHTNIDEEDRLLRTTTVLAVCALLLGACGGSSDGATDSTGGITETAPSPSVPDSSGTADTIETTVPTETTGAGEEGAPTLDYEDEVAVAISDLVERIGVDPEDVTVRIVEEVTWRDGSLGCPLPGMNYTQALIDGVRIVLDVEGDLYHYHASLEKDPFYCADPVEPLGEGSGDV